MNKIFKTTVFGLLISVGIASASHAQFEMNGASDKIQVESIPFVVALRKIVPIDYDFSFETDADLGQVVSYEYKKDWTDTLSSMLAEMGLSHRIAADIIYISKSEVTQKVVTEVDKVEEIVQEVAPLAEVKEELSIDEIAMVAEMPEMVEEEVVVSGIIEDSSEDSSEEVLEEDNYIWKVRQGFTLQETMKSWGEQVGWTVIWDTDRDYDIQSEVSFSGSFVDASSDLINAFAEADPPVIGTFYKNNTLVIETTSNGEVN